MDFTAARPSAHPGEELRSAISLAACYKGGYGPVKMAVFMTPLFRASEQKKNRSKPGERCSQHGRSASRQSTLCTSGTCQRFALRQRTASQAHSNHLLQAKPTCTCTRLTEGREGLEKPCIVFFTHVQRERARRLAVCSHAQGFICPASHLHTLLQWTAMVV